MNVSEADLDAATRRLREQPQDHGAWLEVAALLAALGHADDAELAFAALGEGARRGGQVALAIACGRHLAQAGSLRGPELLERVVETYAAPEGGATTAGRTSGRTSPPVGRRAGTSSEGGAPAAARR